MTKPRSGTVLDHKDATEAAAQVAETYYLTYDEKHEILRANVRAIGAKIAAAIRNQQYGDKR